MPIYGYQCSACGHQKDALQKLSDPVLTTCPQCHKETFARQVSAPAFQLKGSGWYVTDFRDGNKGGDGSKSEDGAKKGESSGPSSSDSSDGGGEAKSSNGTKASSENATKSTSKTESSASKSSDSSSPAPAPASGGSSS